MVTYTGLGDFAQTSAAAEVATLGSTSVVLPALPPATRQVVVTPVSDAGPWAGSALVSDAGGISLLALPLDRACPLSVQVNLAAQPGASIGAIDATHALLGGGTLPPFVIDLGRGAVTQLETSPSPPRSYATITPFGAGALVAGGSDAMKGTAQDTAVVYTSAAPSSGTFGAPIVLPSGQRTKHAAVALADGRVLLVGGVTDLGQPVTAIDVFDPQNPTTPTTLSASLRTGRVAPTAFALPNGQVFVGGGTDAKGDPIASAEWLDESLAWLATQTMCSAATEQGFVGTEGGAVLAVVGAAATTGCSNVHILLPSGVTDAPPLPAPGPRLVRLFAGAQASPVLVTDTGALRFHPWTGAFASLGPSAAGLSLPTSATLAPTPGLALWLGEDDNLWVLRDDTHGEYATDVTHGPYLVTDDLFTAPDQLPGANIGFDVASGATMSNGATVWLTDATFADVTASVVLPSGGAATLVLRDPLGKEVTCAVAGAPPLASFGLTRSGGDVTATLGDAGGVACSGAVDASARVAIGVRGPAGGGGTCTVRALSVQR
jgi:hypothetical protein